MAIGGRRIRRRWFAGVLHMCLPLLALAQIPHGGEPFGWGQQEALPRPTRITIPAGGEQLPQGPEANPATAEYRLGKQLHCDIDLLAQGQRTQMDDGSSVYRLELQSPQARMISVQFSSFQPAPGARLFLYDPARTHYLGGFTQANEHGQERFATAFVPGDAVVIEYQVPTGATGTIRIASIIHAWQSLGRSGGQRDFDPGYQSAPCHINVVCPEGQPWEQQARATLMFVRPDGGTCTATLVNNTRMDGTPYVLVANHCFTPNEGQWVFYFNYQSPTCVGDTGQTQQTMVGAVHRAGKYYGDMCLLELNQQPPPEYNAFYAGWDHSGTAPVSGVAISHPLSDVKKISFYEQPVTTAIAEVGETESWQFYWSQGLLQPGASGAPLFDQNGRYVAHLVEGAQDCSNAALVPSLAAKISANWDDGNTPDARLRDWLDPDNTGAMILDGYQPSGGTQPGIALRIKAMLLGPYQPDQGLMSAALVDQQLLPTQEPYTALGFAQYGSGGETIAPSMLERTGQEQLVDWVRVELRSVDEPAQVLATKNVLIQRNGSVVDVDGSADIPFPNLLPGSYRVAFRHRNHLGVIIQQPVFLSQQTALLDLTSNGSLLSGGVDATASSNGVRCLWSGDVTHNGVIKYAGANNDRDPILQKIGGGIATSTFLGYCQEDVNMDGVVKYTGSNNDRDLLLIDLDGDHINTRADHLP